MCVWGQLAACYSRLEQSTERCRQKPVTHANPHDNPELQIAEEECDSALLHAYVYKPCGIRLVCITRSEEECGNHEFPGRYK